MRVFLTKWFTKWASDETIPDGDLCTAAAEVVAGIYDADLGGSLYKKRLARKGEGKRGGYRLIVGYRDPHSERVVFLFGFPKSEAGNITGQARDAFSLAAEAFIKAPDEAVIRLIDEKKYRELTCQGAQP